MTVTTMGKASCLRDYMSFVHHIIMIGLLLVLTGCGGGGGSGSEGGLQPTSDTTTPSTPQNFSAKALNDSQIALTWEPATDNVDVAGYKIFWRGDHLMTVEGAGAIDTKLRADVAHCYTVSAIDMAGNESTQSNQGCATTAAALVSTPTVAAGTDHTVALKEDGTVWTWGSNSWGQLGDGTNHSRSRPVKVSGLGGHCSG